MLARPRQKQFSPRSPDGRAYAFPDPGGGHRNTRGLEDQRRTSSALSPSGSSAMHGCTLTGVVPGWLRQLSARGPKSTAS